MHAVKYWAILTALIAKNIQPFVKTKNTSHEYFILFLQHISLTFILLYCHILLYMNKFHGTYYRRNFLLGYILCSACDQCIIYVFHYSISWVEDVQSRSSLGSSWEVTCESPQVSAGRPGPWRSTSRGRHCTPLSRSCSARPPAAHAPGWRPPAVHASDSVRRIILVPTPRWWEERAVRTATLNS